MPRGPQSIGNVLAELMARRGFARLRSASALQSAWRDAAGELVGRYSRVVGVRRGKLEVIVGHSALVQELTFPTWTSLDQVPRDEAPFVLKGRSDSRKQRWSTHMYAETWEDALHVQQRLEEDRVIGDQGIVIRKYVPLKTYFRAIGGLPITKEFRVFVYKQQVISAGYYWEAFRDDFPFHCQEVPPIKELNTMFVQQVVTAVGDQATFYVADVAQEQNGDWWLVELNDGQMSGLSGNDAVILYRALYEALTTPGEDP